MSNLFKPNEPETSPESQPARNHGTGSHRNEHTFGSSHNEVINVGRRLRELRLERGFSIRTLAKLCNLNFNTLSLIENGKSSPSVSTLQQLAMGLEVPITAFFETSTPESQISYLKAGMRRRVAFTRGMMEELGNGLTLHGGLPFLVTLEPQAGSGPTPIVHTGYEFVYCLEGRLTYTIEDRDYPLYPGDSLLFKAYLPHYWHNTGGKISRSLLVLCPTDESDEPSKQHFSSE
ncbi:MAG: cupin domain-containing protein [Chloroflexota bacterium]|nr:MAG: cupin domain-containing protein [Chloroflexota bacterium]